MAAISLQSVTRQFGTQVVLENVTLEINPGETVGLVGANGAGKTTLFRLITGELTPDLGTVTRARGLQIGHLRQEPEIIPGRSLHDEVFSVFADLLALEEKLHQVSEAMSAAHDDPDRLNELMEEYERINARFIAAGGHTFETRLNEILGGLGFQPSDYNLPVAALSGGQKCRAGLAKLLLQDREMLLLDEPTNHLDIDAVRWLEKFLAGHHGGAVIISHDRYLLDRLCDRIVEVERRQTFSYPGNYTAYVKAKQLRRLTQERQYEKDMAFIQKERAFIAKHLAGQRTKEAQGRRTRLERRLKSGEFVTEAPTHRRAARLEFDKVENKGGILLRADDLTMQYDSKLLFKDLTLQVQTGQRLGITGPNGTGKSTLLKILLGQVTPVAGEVRWHLNQTIGYYSQEARTSLDPNRTIVEEIRAADPSLSEEQARSLLGAYLFTGDDAFKKLGVLSGGEQSRVRLATLILQAPEVLVLDEPTNHLDIPSREVLESQLAAFEGTIIVVSHDRFFLDRIVDRLLVIRPEGHRLYSGNYSAYVEQLEQEKAAAARQAEAGESRRKPQRGREAKSATKRQSSPYDRMSVEQIEEIIIQRETELAALNEKFGDPAVFKDAAALAELQAKVDAVKAELAAANAAWEERAAVE